MNTIDRAALNEIVDDREMKNMDYTTYLSAVFMSEHTEQCEVVIRDFKNYRLYKTMKTNMNFINQSSVDNSVAKLLELGYFQMDGSDLVIANTGLGHVKDEYFKGDGYIHLHSFFFSMEFFKLPLRAKRLALYLCARLNNKVGKSFPINFKATLDKDHKNFSEWCKRLGVNRLSHIKEAIEQVKKFFGVEEWKHNTYNFSLNTVGQAIIKGTSRAFKYTIEQYQKVKEIVLETNTEVADRVDIEEMAAATMYYGISKIRKVVSIVLKKKRDSIRTVFGYTKYLLENI